MTLLDNDPFLTELGKLFQKSRLSGGAVSITMKRYDGRTKPKPRNADEHHAATAVDYKCLFRAALKARKISTVVNAKDVNKFQLAYSNVLKANMDSLKKRDRKSEKEKSTKLRN